MKRILSLILGICLVLSLSACKPPLEDEKPSPTESEELNSSSKPEVEDDKPNKEFDWVEHRKYELSTQAKLFFTLTNRELYEAVYDAVDKLEARVDVSKYNASEREILEVCEILTDKANGEFFYLAIEQPIKYEGEGIVSIEYGYNTEEILPMKEKFAQGVNYILNEVVDENASNTEKVKSIYSYLASNSSYNIEAFAADPNLTNKEFIEKYANATDEEKEQIMAEVSERASDVIGKYNQWSTYSVIANKGGICFGFAGALMYLCDKLSIECAVVNDTPMNLHAWNLIKLEGEYYHLDVTYEVTSESSALSFFGMTDRERRETSSFQSWKYRFLDRSMEAPLSAEKGLEVA